MNNSIWDIFDKIYCTHYLSYTERFEDIKNELTRIQLLNHQNFEWNFTVDNFIYDDLYKIMLNHSIIYDINTTRKSGDFKNSKVFNLAINIYNKLLEAKYLNYKRVLFLEDDIVFLKDLNKLNNFINNFPLNYDIVNMDTWISYQHKYKNKNIINNYFIDSKYDITKNFSFCSLSNKAIINILNNLNQNFKNADYYICNRNMAKDYKLKYARSNTNLCIQNPKYLIANNNTDKNNNYYQDFCHSVKFSYKNNNLNYEDYNI